jgi:ABC-type glycerol-3-phosphate transport system substrate-binding protein
MKKFANPFIPIAFGVMLTGLSIVGMLAGCGYVKPALDSTPEITGVTINGTEPANSFIETITPIPTATLPVELSSLKGTQIRIIHPWTGDTQIVFRDLIDRFNSENIWGIKVQEVIGGSIGESSRVFSESKQTGDTIEMVVIPTDYLTVWNEDGSTIALDPYISHPEWGIPENEQEDFIKQAWNSNNKDGRLIGLPAQINLQIIVYNKTWGTELGFEGIPDTRSDFYERVCAAARQNNQDTKIDNDGTGGWVINSTAPVLISWINAFDGSAAWENSSSIILNQPETGEAFTYLRKMALNGCAWNSRIASPFNFFGKRQTLAYSATLTDLSDLENLLKLTENPEEWLIIPYPGENAAASVMMSGLSYGIGKKTAEEELASWLFLRWLILPRHQARLAESAGSIPSAQSAIDLMDDYARAHPRWQESLLWLPDAQVIPPSPQWRQIRPVLEDSFWQMLQPTPLPIPTLLEQMDETIRSIP